MPMVVMKVGEKESLAYRSSKHVFPTPESPIMRSLICISYVAVWLMVCVFSRYVIFFGTFTGIYVFLYEIKFQIVKENLIEFLM